MATLAELERALAAADAAGNADDARALANAIRAATSGTAPKSPAAPAATEEMGWGEAFKRGAARFLPNVGEMALGLGEMAVAANPVQRITNAIVPALGVEKPDYLKRGEAGLQALGDIPVGGLRHAASRLLPPEVFKAIDAANPEAGQRASMIASELAKRYGKYGSEEGLKELIATEPAAVLADISGVGALAGKGAQAAGLARAAAAANRVAAVTDPFRPFMAAGGAAARGAGNVADWFSTPRTAANVLLKTETAPGEIVNAMRATQELPVSPGAMPSMGERMVAAGAPSPALARMEAGLADVATPAGREAYMLQQERLARVQEQLARVETQLQQEAATLTPQQTTQLKTVRDNLLQNLAVERAAAEQRGQRVAGMLPDTGQAAPGGAIQERGAALEKGLAKNVITPAYEKSFTSAGDVPIDVSSAVARARQIVGDIGSLMDASTVPESVRKAVRLEPGVEPGTWVSLGERGGYALPGTQTPPTLTLRDFDAFRKALNREYTAALNSQAPDASVRAANLKSVINQLDADLASSGVSAKAKDQYAQAKSLFETRMVPEFRTGETGKMLAEGSFNMPKTLPSETVPAFLKTEEGAAQFVTTFKRDPQAIQAMRTGVADWLREAAVDPATGFLSPSRMDKFIADYGRQLNTLDAGSGTALRPTLDKLRQEAVKAEANLTALNADITRMKKYKNASDLVDAGLASPAEMDFIRQKLSPGGRQALAQELQNRGAQMLKEGNAEGALKYLTENRKALLAGLGADGPKIFGDMTKVAKAQAELQRLQSAAPKPEAPVRVRIPDNLTAKELTDMTVAAKDIQRLSELGELAKAPSSAPSATRRAGTEAAVEAGVLPLPHWIGAPTALLRNIMTRFETKLNAKVAAQLVDFMIKNPDGAVAALEAQAARRARRETVSRAPSQSRAPAIGAAAANVLSGQQTQQNRMRELLIR